MGTSSAYLYRPSEDVRVLNHSLDAAHSLDKLSSVYATRKKWEVKLIVGRRFKICDL